MIYKNIKTNIQIIVHQVIRKLLLIRQSKKRKKTVLRRFEAISDVFRRSKTLTDIKNIKKFALGHESQRSDVQLLKTATGLVERMRS